MLKPLRKQVGAADSGAFAPPKRDPGSPGIRLAKTPLLTAGAARQKSAMGSFFERSNVMGKKSLQGAMRRGQTFRPRLESLEDRWCPSATATFDGGVLMVRDTAGGSINDVISIMATGSNDFQVTAGGRTQTFTDIDVHEIAVDLGSGNDKVTIDLKQATIADLALNLSTGTGNDSLTVDLPELAASADVKLNVNLGEGNDKVTASAGAVAGPLAIDLNAGSGNDAVTIDLGDVSAGANVSATVRLGGGNDKVTASAGAVAGPLAIDLSAGGGNDTVNLDLGDLSADANVSATLGLGGG